MEKDKGKYIMLIFEMVSDTLAVSFTCPLWDIKKHIFCAIAALLQRSMEKYEVKCILLTFEMTADTSAVSFTCPLWKIINIYFALLHH